ncbi:MAG: ThiF family adenylyltransferase [Novosphingobium meiothermophilum]|uniref:ThiF family adenylyltransferase n=1 Tax=Novosphingobium meiothermophilum TaxID=2202251 RepID=UPI000D6E8DC7|nr:ThiF family adenylyltransferase [Novosphingobium meiothermophilum]
MLPTLVSRNHDIRRLVERGYAVTFDSNYLVVRDIPYLDEQRALKWGAIATLLVFIDEARVQQQNHQVSFAGGVPHGLDGRPIPNLGDTPHSVPLSKTEPLVTVERQFSNKPNDDYVDFFDKIERYVAIISGPAMELYDVTPLTFHVYGEGADNSVFKFRDMLTARAEISDLAAAFRDEIVAIIGLGGTGGYVLDFMVKTPTREVRGYDADGYHVHNAYRSPGRLDVAELGLPKAEVFAARYENFRHGLKIETKFIDADSHEELDGVTFAFVCVDKGTARAAIIDLLIAKGISFIDVGMGLARRNGSIKGSMRVTHFPRDRGAEIKAMQLAPTHDAQDDIYKANIQIAELNALNASLAVILYKKHLGFYVDDEPLYNLLFELGDMHAVRQGDED